MKKGLLSTILNILLGIVALIILVAFIWPYVTGFFESGARVDAENDADQLQYLLNSLSEGQQADYFLYSPKGWNIKSFEWTEEKVPPICIGKNCICVRTATDINWLKKTYFCRIISKKIIYQGKDLDLTITAMRLTFENKKDFYEVVSEIKMPEPEKISDSAKTSLSDFDKMLESKGYDLIIENAAKQNNIDANLVKAIMKLESSANPLTIGPCGEAGLMQFMPGTAKAVGISPIFENADFTSCQDSRGNTKPEVAAYRQRLQNAIVGMSEEEASRVDGRFDSRKSIEGGVKHIAGLYAEYNQNIMATIAAYNRGGKIKEDCCPPCPTTDEAWRECVNNKDYLEKVYSYYAYFSSA